MTKVKFITKPVEEPTVQALTYGDVIRVHSKEFPDDPMDYILVQTDTGTCALFQIKPFGEKDTSGYNFFNRACDPVKLKDFNFKWSDLDTENIRKLFPDNLNSGKIKKVKYEITFKEL